MIGRLAVQVCGPDILSARSEAPLLAGYEKGQAIWRPACPNTGARERIFRRTADRTVPATKLGRQGPWRSRIRRPRSGSALPGPGNSRTAARSVHRPRYVRHFPDKMPVLGPFGEGRFVRTGREWRGRGPAGSPESITNRGRPRTDGPHRPWGAVAPRAVIISSG
jgi:hypothetical protein